MPLQRQNQADDKQGNAAREENQQGSQRREDDINVAAFQRNSPEIGPVEKGKRTKAGQDDPYDSSRHRMFP